MTNWALTCGSVDEIKYRNGTAIQHALVTAKNRILIVVGWFRLKQKIPRLLIYQMRHIIVKKGAYCIQLHTNTQLTICQLAIVVIFMSV